MDAEALVPLRRRDGTVRAHAIVDPADYAELSRHRWSLNPQGYVVRGASRDGRNITILMHRQLLGLTESTIHTDHVNGNTLDNRRVNLRAATPRENAQNRCGLSRNNSSGYRGVYRRSEGRWGAYASFGGRKKHLGLYDSPEEAAHVAAAFRAAHMPFSQEAAA